MSWELTGRRALVTGGTRGIGRAIVLALAAAGADVLTCYRADAHAADELSRELKRTNGDHHVVQADVTEAADLERLAATARASFGELHILIHCAGVISHVPFGDLAEPEWRRVLDTNLTAAAMLVRAALPLLADDASIIAVGSGSAMVGIPLRAHYTAAKAGLTGLVRSLAKELGPRGVRVNLISPGVVQTETEIPAEVAERYRKMTPLGRLGRPAEIAAVALFLSSRESSFVSGATLSVDGGI